MSMLDRNTEISAFKGLDHNQFEAVSLARAARFERAALAVHVLGITWMVALPLLQAYFLHWGIGPVIGLALGSMFVMEGSASSLSSRSAQARIAVEQINQYRALRKILRSPSLDRHDLSADPLRLRERVKIKDNLRIRKAPTDCRASFKIFKMSAFSINPVARCDTLGDLEISRKLLSTEKEIDQVAGHYFNYHQFETFNRSRLLAIQSQSRDVELYCTTIRNVLCNYISSCEVKSEKMLLQIIFNELLLAGNQPQSFLYSLLQLHTVLLFQIKLALDQAKKTSHTSSTWWTQERSQWDIINDPLSVDDWRNISDYLKEILAKPICRDSAENFSKSLKVFFESLKYFVNLQFAKCSNQYKRRISDFFIGMQRNRINSTGSLEYIAKETSKYEKMVEELDCGNSKIQDWKNHYEKTARCQCNNPDEQHRALTNANTEYLFELKLALAPISQQAENVERILNQIIANLEEIYALECADLLRQIPQEELASWDKIINYTFQAPPNTNNRKNVIALSLGENSDYHALLEEAMSPKGLARYLADLFLNQTTKLFTSITDEPTQQEILQEILKTFRLQEDGKYRAYLFLNQTTKPFASSTDGPAQQEIVKENSKKFANCNWQQVQNKINELNWEPVFDAVVQVLSRKLANKLKEASPVIQSMSPKVANNPQVVDKNRLFRRRVVEAIGTGNLKLLNDDDKRKIQAGLKENNWLNAEMQTYTTLLKNINTSTERSFWHMPHLTQRPRVTPSLSRPIRSIRLEADLQQSTKKTSRIVSSFVRLFPALIWLGIVLGMCYASASYQMGLTIVGGMMPLVGEALSISSRRYPKKFINSMNHSYLLGHPRLMEEKVTQSLRIDSKKFDKKEERSVIARLGLEDGLVGSARRMQESPYVMKSKWVDPARSLDPKLWQADVARLQKWASEYTMPDQVTKSAVGTRHRLVNEFCRLQNSRPYVWSAMHSADRDRFVTQLMEVQTKIFPNEVADSWKSVVILDYIRLPAGILYKDKEQRLSQEEKSEKASTLLTSLSEREQEEIRTEWVADIKKMYQKACDGIPLSQEEERRCTWVSTLPQCQNELQEFQYSLIKSIAEFNLCSDKKDGPNLPKPEQAWRVLSKSWFVEEQKQNTSIITSREFWDLYENITGQKPGYISLERNCNNQAPEQLSQKDFLSIESILTKKMEERKKTYQDKVNKHQSNRQNNTTNPPVTPKQESPLERNCNNQVPEQSVTPKQESPLERNCNNQEPEQSVTPKQESPLERNCNNQEPEQSVTPKQESPLSNVCDTFPKGLREFQKQLSDLENEIASPNFFKEAVCVLNKYYFLLINDNNDKVVYLFNRLVGMLAWKLENRLKLGSCDLESLTMCCTLIPSLLYFPKIYLDRFITRLEQCAVCLISADDKQILIQALKSWILDLQSSLPSLDDLQCSIAEKILEKFSAITHVLEASLADSS